MDVERLTLTVEQALQLGQEALVGAGIPPDEARVIAEHLVDNMLCGYEFAGLPRVLAIADSPYLRAPQTAITIVHETPASALVDGGNHVGYWPVLQGAQLAAKKAEENGMAVVGVNNCWFSGRNAYYLEHIARRGLIAIHTASAVGQVVPPGARRPLLGTNPLAFGLPGRHDPLIFDMCTSATTWGDVLLNAMLDQHFPEGVGVDADGNPTTSAKDMVKGGILPFGGHKGFGLSLVIQALGLLAGAKRAAGKVVDNGFLFIVIDPALLMPREAFFEQLDEMLDQVRALPLLPGVDRIRIPSERAYAERAVRRREGVALPVKVVEALRALAARR
jgi:LDH2 family malate/lactate/ureidoglycolate dehydrogenase